MSRMTRQHFELIAETLRSTRPTLELLPDGTHDAAQLVAYGTWAAVVGVMMHRLSFTNPAFDRERFVLACGVDNRTEFNNYGELIVKNG